MRNRIRHLLSIFIVCSVAIVVGYAHAAEGQETQASNAWLALKSGNAVVLMRHALAPGIGDPPEFDLERCSTQRNLSDAGRSQARAIGDVLRANGIVEATILSSQWCRCMETARLLDLGNPKPTSMLNSFFQDRSIENEQTLFLSKSLEGWLSRKGEVRVLVTHQVNISSLTGQFTSSGDMLIVTMENDDPVVLARISTDGESNMPGDEGRQFRGRAHLVLGSVQIAGREDCGALGHNRNDSAAKGAEKR